MNVRFVDRPNRRVGVCVSGQQNALGVRVKINRGGNKFDAGHAGHSLVNHQQRDRVIAHF